MIIRAILTLVLLLLHLVTCLHNFGMKKNFCQNGEAPNELMPSSPPLIPLKVILKSGIIIKHNIFYRGKVYPLACGWAAKRGFMLLLWITNFDSQLKALSYSFSTKNDYHFSLMQVLSDKSNRYTHQKYQQNSYCQCTDT